MTTFTRQQIDDITVGRTSQVNVIITDAAMRALRSQTTSPLDTAIRVGPDQWQIQVEEDTWERFQKFHHKGETLSDAIIRLCALAQTNGRTQ